MVDRKYPAKAHSPIGRVLYDYYWIHRGFRTSKFHKHMGIGYKELEDVASGLMKETDEMRMKAVDALEKIRKTFNLKILEYEKELLNESRREHG